MSGFDINAYLSKRKSVIDKALDRYLKVHKAHSQPVLKAMRYGLFPGGKRIRPILALASGDVFGASLKALLPFACALEMIHSYSIIHDDLPALDNDDMRRGVPTVHKVFGEGIALLAGDGLLTEAFTLMSDPALGHLVPVSLVLELIREVSHAAGVAGLVGGQALDLDSEEKEVDLATVEYIHIRKTGALILAAARVGARLGGAKSSDLKRISRYAEYLGLAFQIADDILDAQEQTALAELGESGSKEQRKATYPAVLGMASARGRLHELFQAAVKELGAFGPKAEPLRGIAHCVVERALSTKTKRGR